MSLSKHSKLVPLNPIVVDNLIRVGGRIGQSHLPFEQKHQILLTKEHFLSTLLVLDKHERNYHIGREQTLSYRIVVFANNDELHPSHQL